MFQHFNTDSVLFSLDDTKANDIRLVGGKAFSLHQLITQKFPVPHGFVLSTDFFISMILKNGYIMDVVHEIYASSSSSVEHLQAIERLLSGNDDFNNALREIWQQALESNDRHPEKEWILRSSATVEDGSVTSFAGIFESIMNIPDLDQFRIAMASLYRSVFEQRVLDYCKHRRIPHHRVQLAIVIQEMVRSERSGVAFTINPMNANDREICIEAIHGMGEALVQGMVIPDSYVFNWETDLIINEKTGRQTHMIQAGGNTMTPVTRIEPVLDTSQVKELADLCLLIQAFYGSPQDIEWVWADGAFGVVQARPITSYTYVGEEEWTNADLQDGGISSSVATPLMLSLYQDVFDSSMPSYLSSVNMYPLDTPAAWSLVRFGILYWNMRAVKDGAMKIPGFTELQFDQDLGIEVQYEGAGKKTPTNLSSIINGLMILLYTNRSIARRPGQNKKIRDKMLPVIHDFHELDLTKLPDEVLAGLCAKFFNEYHHLVETSYFKTIYDNSNCKTLFSEKLKSYNNRNETQVDYLNLVSGIKDISHLAPQKRLWEIREDLALDAKLKESILQMSKEDILMQIRVNKEFPVGKYIASFLKDYGYHSSHELDISIEHWDEVPDQVIEYLQAVLMENDEDSPDLRNKKQYDIYLAECSKIHSPSLRKKLVQHRQMLWWREEMRDLSTRVYHILRKIALEVARRKADAGILEDPNHIFFLTKTELVDLSFGKIPDKLYENLRKRQLYYQSFRSFSKPNELIPERSNFVISDLEFENVLQGIPSSSGVCAGTVYNITDIGLLNQVPANAIMVTRHTDPAWTPVFSRLKGLVTETGGVLSHGAIVSREYGIPAVLAVKNCTRLLQTGMIVEVNGRTGSVKIYNDEHAEIIQAG